MVAQSSFVQREALPAAAGTGGQGRPPQKVLRREGIICGHTSRYIFYGGGGGAEREQDDAAAEGKRAKGERDHPPGEDKIGVVDLIGPAFLVRLCRFGGETRGLGLLCGEAFGFRGGLFCVDADPGLGTGGLIGREAGALRLNGSSPCGVCRGLVLGLALEARLLEVIAVGEVGSQRDDPLADALRVDGEQERLLGVEDAGVVLRALEGAVFVRDGDLVRKVVQEIGVARERLLHIVQHLGELVRMRVEVFQRIHHHAGAVIIVLIVFRVDLVVGHREIAAHRLLIRPEIADAVEHGDGQLVV